MRMAVDKANELKVPLIVAGDLHDTKANLRGECVNAIIETFETSKVPTYVLIGNHDKINEKSEDHSLNFLKGRCKLVSTPLYNSDPGLWLIPYYHDPEHLKYDLAGIAKIKDVTKTLIMHQGVENSNSGHYFQDKSALPKECFADFRVISGHYHTRQDIKCGRPQKGSIGLFSYIGNPYTLNFGEANDPPKGFQILHGDGSLEFVPTGLRKHVKLSIEVSQLGLMNRESISVDPADIVMVQVSGDSESLARLTKEKIARFLELAQDFRLDLISTDAIQKDQIAVNQTQPETLDSIIDAVSGLTKERKERLKSKWKNLAYGE